MDFVLPGVSLYLVIRYGLPALMIWFFETYVVSDEIEEPNIIEPKSESLDTKKQRIARELADLRGRLYS